MSTRRDTDDPHGMAPLLAKFLEWLAVHNYTEQTVENRRKRCNAFILWAGERGITKPLEVTKPMVERYQRFLFHRRKEDGQPLSFRTQLGHLTPVRAWFKWLCRQNYIPSNPASEIDLPRAEFHLPKHVLTAREADLVMNQVEVNGLLGLRDRAILEVLYSTGIRRMELIDLTVYSLDRERGLVMVRQGKGKKDRVVPIGERALAWLARYQEDVRPKLVCSGRPAETLFLSAKGEPLRPNALSVLVAEYVNNAELGKRGSCHLFRHTMATLMLEAGADIRVIQEILGHSSLDTTKIYAQVSVRLLKEIHTATHPAKMARNAVD